MLAFWRVAVRMSNARQRHAAASGRLANTALQSSASAMAQLDESIKAVLGEASSNGGNGGGGGGGSSHGAAGHDTEADAGTEPLVNVVTSFGGRAMCVVHVHAARLEVQLMHSYGSLCTVKSAWLSW